MVKMADDSASQWRRCLTLTAAVKAAASIRAAGRERKSGCENALMADNIYSFSDKWKRPHQPQTSRLFSSLINTHVSESLPRRCFTCAALSKGCCTQTHSLMAHLPHVAVEFCNINLTLLIHFKVRLRDFCRRFSFLSFLLETLIHNQ